MSTKVEPKMWGIARYRGLPVQFVERVRKRIDLADKGWRIRLMSDAGGGTAGDSVVVLDSECAEFAPLWPQR